ncbi:MAG: hypothetical protein ACLQMT_07020 [Candidatus Acidiferrales bacterium]
MAFIPDVIVTTDYSPATIALVAEAKGAVVSLDEAALPLKQYMLQMSCPVGIILTPQVLRIYKDRFLGRTEESIVLVGDFPSEELFKARKPVTESAVESALVEWLEEVAETGQTRVKDVHLKSAIDEHILPSISGGRVSVVHPRTLEA